MLSDGAGAVALSSDPPPGKLALKVEWIENFSFADELETCMYAGAVKSDGGKLRGWRAFPSIEGALEAGAFAIKQDVKLLNEEIVRTSVDRTLPHVLAKHPLSPGAVDWFLPHYSSEFFREKLHASMVDFGFAVDQERWFSNLATRGNTGSASIYLMLEELFHSGRISKGERILCFIPESGRFSTCYMLLTAVA